MSDEIRLDWAAAEVRDGELTVPLSGEPGTTFEHAFETTVRLLGAHADWGEIELHDGAVRVKSVQPGCEEAVRHHVDSVVLQAEAAEHQEAAQADQDADEATGPDAEMTERFRAFGDAAGDRDADGDARGR